MNYKIKFAIVWLTLIIVLVVNMQIIYSFFVKIRGGDDTSERNSIEQIFKIETNFKHEIVNMLQQMYDQKLMTSKIFLIDHHALKTYLTDYEVDMLIERRYLPTDYIRMEHKKNKFVSFGIFHYKLKNIQKQFVNLISIGWTIKVLTSNGKFVQSINPIEPLHVFLTKAGLVVQLVVFYAKDNYHWIGGFPNHTVEQVAHHLSINDSSLIMYGRYDAIYDYVLLQQQQYLSLPMDTVYFIQQATSSRFVQCKLPIAQRFSILYQDHLLSTNELKSYKTETLQAIQTMKTLSRWLMIDIWLFSDALLSWYRNCGPVIRLKNFEFTFLTDQITSFNLTEKLFEFFEDEEELSSNKIFISEILGNQSSGIVYRLETDKKNLVYINLLESYRNQQNDKNVVFTKNYLFVEVEEVLENHFIHPFSGLCSADYSGEKVLVPCDSFETIKNEYGPTWPLPVTEWGRVFKPFNRVNQTLLPFGKFPYYENSQSNSKLYFDLIPLLYWTFYIVVIVMLYRGFKYVYDKKKQK